MLQRLRIRTPVAIGFVLVVGGIFVSEGLSLYTIPWFDKVMHTAGGIVAAWFALALLQNEITRMRAWKQIIIILGVAMLIGVVWEWAEYAATLSRTDLPWVYRWFHGGDLADTLGDLIADTGGAILMLIWALRKERAL